MLRVRQPGMRTGHYLWRASVGLLVVSFGFVSADGVGETRIARWQYGRKGAVSLTYDDGSINQFRVAVPIMNVLGFPATFFITGRRHYYS